MLLRTITGSGLSEVVIDRSALVPTAIPELALLLPTLGSPVPELTEAVSVISVPSAVPLLTFTTNVKVALVPLLKVAMLQLIAPVPPTAGCVGQAQPAGNEIETKVVFAGVAPLNMAAVALAGPPLLATCV